MADLRAALDRIGLGQDAVDVYGALLDGGPADLAGVAARTGRSPAAVREAFDSLVELGLTAPWDDLSPAVVPVPPAEALQVLLLRQAAELEESRTVVTGAFERFRRAWPGVDGHSPVEVVTGPAVAVRAEQAWLSARQAIRQLESPPYVHIDSALEHSLETLGRGVQQRVVYSRAALDRAGYLDDVVRPCMQRGEKVRVAESVPVKLVLIDDVCAQVSPAIGDADVHHTMYVVHPSGLLSAIEELFELTWRNAVPVSFGAQAPDRIPAPERKLYLLLASGMRDDDIAHSLGISRRTLSRRIEVAMARTGAANRFQLGIQAHLRGWV